MTEKHAEGLLPCPFCGSTPEIRPITDNEGWQKFICPKGSSCDGSRLYSMFKGTASEAVAAWNRRATIPAKS